MTLRKESGAALPCDFPECQEEAIAECPILDDDNEDQGTQIFCQNHHPNNRFKYWDEDCQLSDLVRDTDPTDFLQVSKLVLQTESLLEMQKQMRGHRSL